MLVPPPAPRVTLDAPRMLTQGSDLAAVARFETPDLEGTLLHPLPADALFRVRTPNGDVHFYRRGSAETRAPGDTFQLAVRAAIWGAWHVRVQGTVLCRGQPVVVAAEVRVLVNASVFA